MPKIQESNGRYFITLPKDLVERKGLAVQEMSHTRQTTLCCGEGGAV